MRRMLLTICLVALGCVNSGCGGSEDPKKDAEGKAAKAPELPPTGP